MSDATEHDKQLAELRSWHTKSHEMHVAHIKEAVRCGRLGRGLGVSAAILATFTGATWVTDLSEAGGPSTVLRWVAAIAGLVSGALVAVNTTMDYLKRAGEHQAASVRYGKLRYAMEAWRIEHRPEDHPSHEIIGKWTEMWAEAEESPAVVGGRALGRAKEYISMTRRDVW